jgi:phosphate starvation-inducible protein PhoH and related proteins
MAKSKRAVVTGKSSRQQNTNVVEIADTFFYSPTQRKKHVTLEAKNPNQEAYIRLLNNDSIKILFALGPAGTGKTLLACQAAVRALQEQQVNKIIVTRPAVTVDEDHGFLPGTLQEKMAPWTRPIFDVFYEYWNPRHVEYMIENNVIEISPLAYMRGRTFKNAFIVADEMQNATISQTKMLLTRLGDYSRMVVTGDLAQSDRTSDESGLQNFLDLYSDAGESNSVRAIQFDNNDVERHPVVKEILRIYKD